MSIDCDPLMNLVNKYMGILGNPGDMPIGHARGMRGHAHAGNPGESWGVPGSCPLGFPLGTINRLLDDSP